MNKRKRLVRCRILVVLLLFLLGEGVLFAQSSTVRSLAEVASEPERDYLYFDLNCNVDAWEGYFAPDRWQCNVRKNSPLAEVPYGDQNDAFGDFPLVVVGRNHEVIETWSIDIPAPGYLSFQLMPADMANLEALSVRINDRTVRFNLRSDGLYYSPYLRIGDRFALQIPAGKATYRWTNLLFHTNFNAVIVRPKETEVAQRYVPIAADLIQRVSFPGSGPGRWPVFDLDGDAETLDDRTELRASGERFSVEYQDEVKLDQRGFYLERTFVIQEQCSRGSRLRSQRRWAGLPIVIE